MEGAEQCPVRRCFCIFPKLRLWVLEYVWAHKPADLHQVLDLIMLPEMDLQPLSLEDSWRLRVASAQMYSIVKNRDVKNFERVVYLLENVYGLVPRLVAPIKHMKIVFGLKTMFIMRMLREHRGMVETMLKINQFFPNKLPQYQGQCSRSDMFLMIKNHVDFRSVAQALTMDRAKLQDYILNEMEGQYGDHYAQKVEDRLLHFLNELEAVLLGKTHIDKVLDKSSPATEEERLLVEVVTAASIGTTLKTLLRCATEEMQRMDKDLQVDNVVCCRLDSRSPEQGTDGAENAPRSKVLLQTVEDETWKERRHDSPTKYRRDAGVGDDEGPREATASLKFCTRHGQWVETILQHCTDETEELSPPPASPLLFLSSSSSSGSSSDDLTPSDLVPQHAPSQTPSVALNEHTTPEEKPSSLTQRPLQPSASQHGSLVDAASELSSRDLFAPPQASPDNSSNGATLQGRPRDGETQMERDQGQTSPSFITSHQLPTQKSLTEPSRMIKRICRAKRSRDSFEAPSSGFATSCVSSSGSASCSGPLVSTCTSESLMFFPQCSAHRVSPSGDGYQSSPGSCRQPQGVSASQSPACADASFSSDSTHLSDRSQTSRFRRPHLRLSLPCQATLLQSKLFQPYVSLTRLSCQQRSSQLARGEEEDLRCSFDPNTLYSSFSSSSGGDDSLVYDPDYKPNITKKQLLLEYEAARTVI